PGGAQTTIQLTLINFGTEKVVLKHIRLDAPPGSFSLSSPAGETVLAPGENLPVTLTFDPQFGGDVSASLFIDSNDSSAQTQIHLTGIGQSPLAALQLSVPNNNLGGARQGADGVTVQQFATITSTGLQPLGLSAVRVTQGADEFAVGALPADFPANPIR